MSIALAALALAGAALAASAAPAKPSSLKVCVYYDPGPEPSGGNGLLHAVMLENLLGHFREAAVVLSPAAGYSAGGLGTCDRVAYIGSRYDAVLERDFLTDAARFDKPFLWVNYNIRQLQEAMGAEAFGAKWGFVFLGLRGFDPPSKAGGIPDFYRGFEYGGEHFTKLAYVRKEDGAVVAAPELALLGGVTGKVLAKAIHSRSGDSTPYVVQKGGSFFVGDNPFVYIGEDDRYLILADLLFDFLKLAPRDARRHALVRLEDVHPNYDLKLLHRAIDVLKERKVPFALSVIPKYVPAGRPEAEGVGLKDRPEFVKALLYAQANGGVLLLHGYTHSVAGLDACPPLASGADYEFWDRCRQAPLSYDSADFARGRMAKARASLAAVGLSAVGWVTPHYTASPIDFAVFAGEFDRTVQRARYAVGEPGGPVSVSQFFPYTVYKDHYGQFVWPENLGFVGMPDAAPGERGAVEIVRSARRTRVVRDAWASFFWHPQLANTPGEVERLGTLTDEIRALGYEFVSLDALRARDE
ncbi:MAG: DUF2334 domain-containing protein [Elusimicrobia bacterium]|nr:DUF2334 domain-containing protein [Elusimicrobiota bacterium]